MHLCICALISVHIALFVSISHSCWRCAGRSLLDATGKLRPADWAVLLEAWLASELLLGILSSASSVFVVHLSLLCMKVPEMPLTFTCMLGKLVSCTWLSGMWLRPMLPWSDTLSVLHIYSQRRCQSRQCPQQWRLHRSCSGICLCRFFRKCPVLCHGHR